MIAAPSPTEVRRLRILVEVLRDWKPSGLVDRDDLARMVRIWLMEFRQRELARPIVGDPLPPDWDSTGEETLDTVLRHLESRVDPELSYVPTAGPTRRIPRWVPG